MATSGTIHARPGAGTAAATTAPAGAPPFTFTVIGDTPYSTLEERSLQGVLAAQGPDVAFVLHVGDLKSGWELCSNDLIRRRHALLRNTPRPLIFVPGDNEWVDCSRSSAGSFDPLDRLALLRKLFHHDHPPPEAGLQRFARQSQLTPSRNFPEHMRWLHQGVAFVTLNVPGSHNARSSDGPLRQANRERIAAVAAWLEQTAEWAASERVRAIVIASHANPGFENDKPGRPPVHSDDPDDAYAWWRSGLRTLAARLPLPILLLHGDTHSFRVDQPLKDKAGNPLREVTRLECFGTPRSSAWVRVTVTDAQPAGFFVAIRELESLPRH